MSDSFRDQIDWYVRCLEDVQDGRVVRGLAEAKAGYDSAMDSLADGVWLSREEAVSIASALNTNPAWWDMANTLAARLSEAPGV